MKLRKSHCGISTMKRQRVGTWPKSANRIAVSPKETARCWIFWCGRSRNWPSKPSSCITSSVDEWMVSPRKSRKKSACFSRTSTCKPVRANNSPSIMPAGPAPTIKQCRSALAGVGCAGMFRQLALACRSQGRLARLHGAEITAVVRRADQNLVDANVRWLSGDEDDQRSHILGLQHARHRLGCFRDWSMYENRGRHLAGADDAGADPVPALLEIDGVAHRHHAMLGRRIAGSRYRADEAAGPGSGMDNKTIGLFAHDRQRRLHDVKGAQQIAANKGIDARRCQRPPGA